MDGASASEVDRGQVVQPALAAPGPACQGAVDDGSPAEAEDQGGDDVASLEGPADNDHHLVFGQSSPWRGGERRQTVQAQNSS